MEALDATENRGGALEAADEYVRRLRENFDAAPDPDVIARAERIRCRPAGSVGTLPRSSTAS